MKQQTFTAQLCHEPTPQAAQQTIRQFVGFCPASDYQADLLKMLTYAMSSQQTNNDALDRGNIAHFVQQLHQVIPAVYVLFNHQTTKP